MNETATHVVLPQASCAEFPLNITWGKLQGKLHPTERLSRKNLHIAYVYIACACIYIYIHTYIHTYMHACMHCIALHYITYIYVLFLRHFCANAHGEWKAEHTFAICTRGPQNSSWIFVENKNIPPIFMMCNLRVLDLELQKSEGYGSKDFQGT